MVLRLQIHAVFAQKLEDAEMSVTRPNALKNNVLQKKDQTLMRFGSLFLATGSLTTQAEKRC